MKLKKFVAPTTREALQKLRAELGEDAIILSTKQTAAGTEVLAASSNDMDNLTVGTAEAQRPSPKTEDEARFTPPSWRQTDRQAFEQQRTALPKSNQVPAAKESEAVYSPRPKQAARHEGLGVQASAPASASTNLNPSWQEQKTPAHAPEYHLADTQAEMLSDIGRQRALAAGDSMVQEQAQVLEEIKQMRQLMKDQMAMLTWRDSVERNPLRGEVWNTLSNAGFSPLFARTVADKMPETLSETQVQDWLSNVLKRNLSVIKADEDIVERGGAWALVGPTGVGKTTTTAKLAARCVVKYGADSLGLITTDSYRIGAQDQLRIYGKILGVQVYTAQNDADLAQLRSSMQRKRLLLIDTVGMGQRDTRVGEQTQMLVDSHVKRLLLLNGTCHPETLEDVVTHYKNRGLEGAILTKLDESIKLGGVLDVTMRHKLKLYYMATGQRVPEDLFIADPRVLVHRALKAKSSSAFQSSGEELKWKMAQVPATGI
ncbi:MAG: flagellar biosynthesis protein FlhF [Limnobacter sp.]|nr:flagellar biosynthesis protein FlhF [Limnobacter sp.]